VSYSFSDVGRFLADLGTTYTYPVAIGAWIRYASHPSAIRYIGQLAKSSTGSAESHCLATNSTSQVIRAETYDAGVGSNAADSNANGSNNTWLPGLAVFLSDTDRRIYFNSTTAQTNSNSRVAADVRYISIGRLVSNNVGFTGDIAEFAIWAGGSGLSAGDISDFIGGTSPGLLNASELRFYNPLRQSDYNADPLAVGPSLSTQSTAPSYTAAHPTIDYGTSGAKRLLLMGVG